MRECVRTVEIKCACAKLISPNDFRASIPPPESGRICLVRVIGEQRREEASWPKGLERKATLEDAIYECEAGYTCARRNIGVLPHLS